MAEAGRTEGGGSASGPARLLIIAGPTGSGKSALALALAARLNGAIVNADAMQCYAALRHLTARPSEAEEARLPHFLYGVLPPDRPGNAAWWRGQALAALQRIDGAGRLPILCGGTGLYLSALLHGIADIPEPPAAARVAARSLLARIGPAALHAKLLQVDPATAAALRPTDSQRLARAWEVWTGTGSGLKHWQAQPRIPLSGYAPRLILLDPPRAELREAVARRFTAMLKAGALEELRRLLALDPDPALPLMRALGVPELSRHLRGEVTLATATEAAILATGRYTRRQATWFRHRKLVRNADMHSISSIISNSSQFSERFLDSLENFIKSPVDATSPPD